MSNSLLSLIGNTPLVKSRVLNTNPNVSVYFKMEGHNPGGSVKDRAAYNMIKTGYDNGDFTANDKLIEATSGNTGIALAMIAGVYGLDIELVMPENSTKERVQTMRAYGAKVTLTSGKHIIKQRDLKFGTIPKVKSPTLFPLWVQRVPSWELLRT